MKNAPCYNCEDRYPGCHSKCVKPEYRRNEARKQIITEAKYRDMRCRATTHHWKSRHSANNSSTE